MNNFKREIDNLNPSEREKNMIYRNILSRSENKKKKFALLKPIISFSLILGISVSAYAIHSNNKFTTEVLNYSASEFASNLNLSSSFDDNKVTVESLFGTDESIFLVCSLENTKGKKINDGERDLSNFGFKKIYLSLNNSEESVEQGSFYTLSHSENPNKIYFLIKSNLGMFNENNFKNMDTINLHLENSNLSKFTKDQYDLEIPLDYKSLNTNYVLNHTFNLKDGQAKIDSVSISDLDMLIKFSSTNEALKDFTRLDFEDELPIKLIFKDGRSLNYTTRSGSSNQGDSGFLYYSFLNNDLNLKDFDHILLMDEMIFLK